MRAGYVAGLVNLDGCTLSFTRVPVEMPLASAVAEFLPSYHPQHAFIRGDKLMAQDRRGAVTRKRGWNY